MGALKKSEAAEVRRFLLNSQAGEIRQEVLGSHAPGLTVIITGIFAEKWLLEIEATAAA